jgi:hypothetical protein
MQLELSIKGSPSELSEFLTNLSSGDKVSDLVSRLVSDGQINLHTMAGVEEKESVFSQVKFGTIYLCRLIIACGETVDDGRILSFEDILAESEDYENTMESRQVSSRIGGLKKVTERLGLPPVIEITRKNKERYARFNTEYESPLERFVLKNDEQWLEWLEEECIESDPCEE